MPRLPFAAAVAALATLAAGQAEAHAPGAGAFGFASGLSHPFLGVDHLLAMVGVGLLAMQQQAARPWMLPAVFVAAMAAGLGLGVLGLGAVPLEAGIVGSVLLLGGLVAWGRALPAGALVAVVAASAALHGHAHGLEMPAEGSAVAYALGALAGTAALHAAGVGAARVLKDTAVRACGAAFAAVGVLLIVA